MNYKEQTTIKNGGNLEAQENKEIPHNIEVSENLYQEMVNKSEKETDYFKKESKDYLAQIENKAEKDGVVIDDEQKESFRELSNEADVAKKELIAEIGDEKESGEKIPTTKEQQDAFEKGKEKALSLQAEGNDNSPEYWDLYSHLTEGIRENIEWKNAGNINAEKVEKMLASEFPEKNQMVMRACPKCGQEYLGANVEYCSACGSELKLKQTKIKSSMENRIVESAELLSAKEASKKNFTEERKKLAMEIREQRRLQKDRLAILKMNIENVDNVSEKMYGQKEDEQYGRISEAQSNEANILKERLTDEINIDEKETRDEKENILQLVDNSKGVELIKAKLEEHYAKADTEAKNNFESIQKTVEQTLLRNNVFIVHAFLKDERNRHNENSNISNRATLEDDLNILLSLEPSISTSSVVPGSKQGLWGGLGVVLGGGDIRGVEQTDAGTKTGGIKSRDGKISSSQEIDEKVSNKEDRGYNEIVVNNPKVFGFFQNVSIDESEKMVGFISSDLAGKNNEFKNNFMRPMNLAKEKGMPLLIMTPNRKLFEFIDINESGIVSTGKEITPEQVAVGKAGLSDEKRKEIGEEIIAKNLFRKIDDQKEAKGIIAGLSGQENTETELSREEYLAFTKDNPDKFHELPARLAGDKEFMMEVAEFNPVSAYKYAGENLKSDINFIKRVYSLEKKGTISSIYSEMPDELKKDESIALLVIENNDFEALDSDLADSPLIWEKIVNKIVEKKNPDKWFSRNKGEKEILDPSFFMRKGFIGVNMTERLITDSGFIQKLNSKYPNYKFEIDDYKQLLVTKLTS